MRVLFLIFMISTVWAQGPANVEEEKRKAAEVLGATYTPTKQEESLIDFSDNQMNDEEKEAVLANYERSKNEYKEDAGDTLFEKISKAYVRNLDRVLVKKKSE